MVARADELWDELQKESRRELRTITGVLLTGAPEDPEMQRAVQNAAATGTPHMIWNERTLVRRIPQFRPDPGDIAIWDARGGFIRPELSVATAAGVAERLGARVCRNRQVLDVSQSSDRVHIRTDAGTDIYDRAIVAVGAWTPKLLPRFRDLILPRRLISAWFFARDAEYLAGLPPFIRPLSTYAYGVPTVDGNAVKIGLGFAHHMRADDPDRVERTVQPDELAPFQEVVQRYLPGLDPHPMRTETYLEGIRRRGANGLVSTPTCRACWCSRGSPDTASRNARRSEKRPSIGCWGRPPRSTSTSSRTVEPPSDCSTLTYDRPHGWSTMIALLTRPHCRPGRNRRRPAVSSAGRLS